MSYRRFRGKRDTRASGDGAAFRPAPAAIENEQWLLVALMLDNSLIPRVAAQLSREEFYYPSHGELYQRILEDTDKGKPVHITSMHDAVKNITINDLSAWSANCLSSLWWSYLEAVKKTARARRLLLILQTNQQKIYTDDIAAVSTQLITDLVQFQGDDGRGGDFELLAERPVTDAYKIIERAQSGFMGIPTGLTDFDDRIGGLEPGGLHFIGARPSIGKTSLGLTISTNAARKGFRVAFCSLEMTSAQVAMRVISRETGIENRDLRRQGRLHDRDFSRIIQLRPSLSSLPFLLCDSERSWPKLHAKIRGLKLQHPDLSLVVIDYIGLVRVESDEERYLELGIISSESKALAVDLKLAIVLLSQLNRAVESRTDKKPQLADLRESGNLEQDADIVMLLHRPEYYDREFKPKGLALLDVAKNRNGVTGVIRLRFDPRTVSFSDWVDPPAEMRGAVNAD